MNTPHLQNESGVTLVELIVSLALTGLVLTFVVSGVLFVQSYLDRWKHLDAVAEDTAFLGRMLSDEIRRCREWERVGDSLIFIRLDGSRRVFVQKQNSHYDQGRPLLRPAMHLKELTLSPFSLPPEAPDSILNSKQHADSTGLVKLRLTVVSAHAADTFVTIVRNDHAYQKYSP